MIRRSAVAAVARSKGSFQAAKHGHADVQNNEVGNRVTQALQCDLSRRGDVDLRAEGVFQRVLEKGGQVRIILDHDNPRHLPEHGDEVRTSA